MIRSLDNLIGYRIIATNGDIGTVEDFYFDDNAWLLRYVVVAAGGWMNRRHVLLSMDMIGEVSDLKREMNVNLTKESVYASPDTESDQPVSRQNEILLAKHFGWKPYWAPDPFLGLELPNQRMEINVAMIGANPHLRSFREVTTYVARGSGIETLVSDMIADDSTGNVQSLVLSREAGRGADAHLMPTDQVDRLDWTNCQVRLKANADAMLTRFDPAAGVNARRTAQYYDYFGRLHHTVLLKEERN